MTKIENEISKAELEEIYLLSKQQFGNECWTFEQFEGSFKQKNSIFLVVKQNNKVASFLLALDVVDSINLLLIATESSFQRKGFGKMLIKELENFNKTIWLEVRQSNAGAIAFYKNCGFKFLYERKKYYSNGESALIFEKKVA